MSKKSILILLILSASIYAQVTLSDVNAIANEQLDILRSELKNNTATSSVSNEVNDFTQKTVSIVSSNNKPNSENFGYSFFQKDINFFDNIPTPVGYKLGPGDEIILSLWGETNSRQNFIINKDGLIFYEDLGFINLANKTLDEAESILLKELSKVYATLNDSINSTELKIELSNLKSMNVYFTGQVNDPGIHLIHPFSDVMTALIQAGGVKESGSLRTIQIIRNNKVIKEIDLYNFLIQGINDFSNIKIIDSDVINVPVIKRRAEITGEVINSYKFELLPNENLNELINFANGFTAEAGKKLIINQIIPTEDRTSDDNVRSIDIFNREDIIEINKNLFLTNEAAVQVPSVLTSENKVSVFGQVKRPDSYFINEKTTLKTILDIAGGFEDLNYRKSILDEKIIVLRRSAESVYSLEYTVTYETADNFILYPKDKIFVYANSNYSAEVTFSIDGAVNYPGTYQFKEGMNIEDAINRAGGLSIFGFKEGLVASVPIRDGNGNVVTSMVQNITYKSKISNGMNIQLLPKSNVVSIRGNVQSPGAFSIDGFQPTVKNTIEVSGGLLDRTNRKKIYVQAMNGKSYTPNFLQKRFKRLNPGDIVYVPKKEDREKINATTLTSDLVSILTNLATIIFIIDSNDN
tara:strand:+ start:4441 stop:6351 length:1911 start_codon:yes stop_codon:yes gene_type:complete